ncbi:3-phosphoshikimate 1-carboxyvinyltransferase [Nonomuraea sp. NPDC003214]
MDFLQYKQLHVHPAKVLKGEVVPPASKSYSARAVLAASLAPGTSLIDNVASSNNVKAMMECCQELGARLTHVEPGRLQVEGPGRFHDGVTLSPGNSGIVLRLLMGAAARNRGITFMTPYLDSLGRRANQEMVDALRTLGVVVEAGEEGTLPITLDGSAAHGGEVEISGRRSSQFLSGLLFLGGLLDDALSVRVPDELKAKAMVRTTLTVLGSAGVEVAASEDMMSYRVPAATAYQPAHYVCGSDPASTAALLAVAACVDSTVELRHHRLEELDGVLAYLRDIGVSVTEEDSTLRVQGGGELRPLDFDGSLAPDAVLPLAALAAHADGTSRFYNIEHIRYKECDRISDFRRELERAGIACDEKRDELIVHGSPAGVPGGVTVDSHYDHAVVMAMSVVALRSRTGLTIKDPQYVAQTYPRFFDDLQRLGATVDA